MSEATDAQSLAAKVASVLGQRLAGFVSLEAVDRLSGGASQETYRISVTTSDGPRLLAMRRAPGGVVAEEHVVGHPGLAAEALLMRSAAAAGVPEPDVVHVLTPDDGIGDGFIMSWLEGEALGARIARAPDFTDLRGHLAYDCGRILARIHAIDLQATGLSRALDAITPEEFLHQTWDRYKEWQTPQPMIDYTGRWLLENLPKNPRTALVHNDFRNGNFMVDQNAIVAVLDWELAHIGDPMRDLGWICTNSWRFGVTDLPVGGFGLREDLYRGYADESGIAVDPDHVKFWEVFGSFWWAVGCLGMAEHYRTGPDQTVERPAIGRRTSECQVDCVNLLIPGETTVVEALGDDDGVDMPTLDELLGSVRDFLHQDVMQETSGRLNFLARVAGNSLDIVRREAQSGARLREQELSLLQALLDSDQGTVAQLRWQLVYGLRNATLDVDAQALQAYLRFAVVNQVAIDQPKYSGYRTARRNAGLSAS
ncbi:MAG: phosphotransferase family protein [Pseudomonadales bacterium]